MRVEDIPQDDSILEGHRRACYAQDAEGRYVLATSRGWDVERVANQQAVTQITARIARVHQQVVAGELSPLAYHMTRFHMEPGVLAAHVSLWTYRTKRHLKPRVFSRLPLHLLKRYADVFGIDVETLRTIPSTPPCP